MDNELDVGRHGDLFPRPDPTKLTTEQLVREIASLKEVVFTRLDGMDKAITLFNENITRVPTDTDKQISHLKMLHETRFQESDKAISLLQNIFDRIPSQMDEKLRALRELNEEKFISIQTQFKERDVRTESSSKDAKIAVDAALQAAKEAVGEQTKSSALAIGKSEAATIKQIDTQSQLLATTARGIEDKIAQVGQLLSTKEKGLDDKIISIKERMDRMEGAGVGRTSSKLEGFNVISIVIAVISLLIAAAVLMKHW